MIDVPKKQKHKETLPESPNKGLVKDKFRTAFGIYVDRGPNVTGALDLLYDAVYFPDDVAASHDVQHSEKFPSRLEELEAKLESQPQVTPEREEFIRELREQLTRSLDQEALLFPGAKDAVEKMARKAPVAIWTQGDMFGGSSSFDGKKIDLPGSREQWYKIHGVGFTALRNLIAMEKDRRNPILDKTQQTRPKDVISFHPHEDKFGAKGVKKLADYFKGRGIQKVVVIEDKLGNIHRLRPLLEAEGIEVEASVLITKKNLTEKGVSEDEHPDYVVPSISEMTHIIEGQPEGVGFICDFDGVITDQSLRWKVTAKAVANTMEAKGWL